MVNGERDYGGLGVEMSVVRFFLVKGGAKLCMSTLDPGGWFDLVPRRLTFATLALLHRGMQAAVSPSLALLARL